MIPMATPEQTQTMVCYRHPQNETAVTCSNCGRPICTECMVFAPVGIKCPECAGTPTGAKKAAQKVSSVGSAAPFGVTEVLVGVMVLVFIGQLAVSGGNIGSPEDTLFQKGALAGFKLEQGEWYRLVTNAFLHGNLLHIFFNALMLWWLGRPLEHLIGHLRFAAIVIVSILAGSAGALVLMGPSDAAIGASGAVFGILGAGIVLEQQGINVFGGSALVIAALNLGLGFVLGNVSIGGHIGGLIGGALCITVLGAFGKGHAVYGRFNAAAAAGLAAVAVGSVLIAYFKVRGYA